MTASTLPQKLFQMATLTALGFNEAVKENVSPQIRQNIEQSVTSGAGELCIVIRHDGASLRAWMGVVEADSPPPFEEHLVRVQGLMDAAVLPPDQVRVYDPTGKPN